MLPIAHSRWQEHTDFGIEKALTATSASSVTRALYCPGRTGLPACSPGSIKKGKRRVCHGFHGSSSSQNAGLPRASGNASNAVPDAVEDPLLSPGITGYRGAWRSPFVQESERQRAGSRSNASRVPACKLLFARTEPIRSALFSRAGSSREPWQRQALSSVRRTCPQSPCAGQGSRRCRDQGQCQSP